MVHYKFLRTGAIGPFSGFAWPRPTGREVGPWVHVDGGLVPCRHGIHACRLSDLPYWISDELWAIEVADAHTGGRHVLARSGRLVERVSAWNPMAAAAFAEACTWRLRDRVVAALSAAGSGVDAEALDACTTLAELRAVAAAHEVPATGDGTPVSARTAGDLKHLVGYLVDALTYGADGHTSTVAFVVAHAAARSDGDEALERSLQVAWFEALLGAAPPATRRNSNQSL